MKQSSPNQRRWIMNVGTASTVHGFFFDCRIAPLVAKQPVCFLSLRGLSATIATAHSQFFVECQEKPSTLVGSALFFDSGLRSLRPVAGSCVKCWGGGGQCAPSSLALRQNTIRGPLYRGGPLQFFVRRPPTRFLPSLFVAVSQSMVRVSQRAPPFSSLAARKTSSSNCDNCGSTPAFFLPRRRGPRLFCFSKPPLLETPGPPALWFFFPFFPFFFIFFFFFFFFRASFHSLLYSFADFLKYIEFTSPPLPFLLVFCLCKASPQIHIENYFIMNAKINRRRT